MQSSPVSPNAAPSDSSSLGPQCLVIHHDKAFLQSASDLLSKDGFRVETATNSVSALLSATKQPFDLILCELELPDHPGPSLLKLWRKEGIQSPFAFVTQKGSPSDEDKAYELGAWECFRMPIRPSKFVAAVKAIAADAKAGRAPLPRKPTGLTPKSTPDPRLTPRSQKELGRDELPSGDGTPSSGRQLRTPSRKTPSPGSARGGDSEPPREASGDDSRRSSLGGGRSSRRVSQPEFNAAAAAAAASSDGEDPDGEGDRWEMKPLVDSAPNSSSDLKQRANKEFYGTHDSLQLPFTLGDIELTSLLARGGMSAVYKGRQISLDRPVAVKVLAPETDPTGKLLERFLLEARSMAALSHPNIVKILSVGHEQVYGLRYIVMEFLDGDNLDKTMRRYQLCFGHILHLAISISKALEHSSSRGIVHRDIKPKNIMITSGNHVVLLDFGIAKSTDQDLGLTREGSTIGTPEFMSPEQIRGEAVDVRSDLYSLGLILYEMLAGAKPFIANNKSSLFVMRLHEQPKKLAEVRPNIPLELAEIVHGLVETDRDKRIKSPRELRKRLEALKERLGREKRLNEYPSSEPAVRKPRTDRSSQPEVAVPQVVVPPPPPVRLPYLIAAVTTIVAAAIWAVVFFRFL